ncbi:hypothetical protein DNTS_016939 [Danionella cerebrum]|uniref:Pyrroline-5-carboxylate reductase catalytic N-terminal domain-containing protein n=1 Tax=Danionella cerebrum TaxID=2873325 RepID=A0A553QG11_9TELE|nr:hypothetical protein DNTS_016939 [Danionella translucida]
MKTLKLFLNLFRRTMAEDLLSPLLLDSEDPPDAPCESESAPAVVILGSGDFSRSLALRLLDCGIRAVVGSRCVNRIPSGTFPDAVDLRSQEVAVSQSASLIFLAIFPEHYGSLSGLRPALAGKVLVDVSNAAQENVNAQSNAERLAEMFPESLVVKGFNTVSAWELQTGPRDGSTQVPICSGSTEGKRRVANLARRMGLHPVDYGGLSAAREIEVTPLRLFPSWRGPVTISLLLFLFFYLYGFLRGILLPFLLRERNSFYLLALDLFNQSLPAVALVVLALVYLPGLLAAWLQLWRGTKYQRFPSWLDHWMQRRKQLGLLSFFCASLHGVYSVCQPLRRVSQHRIINAAYRQVRKQRCVKSRFWPRNQTRGPSRSVEARSTDADSSAMCLLQVEAGAEQPWDEPAVWRSELYLSCGVLALGVLSLLAITSLPSVVNTLSWREFSFVQSGLGYVALSLSLLHTLFFGWDFAFHISSYPFFMPPIFVLGASLPCFVLACRCFLLLPCVSSRLKRIRRGWEHSRKCPVLQEPSMPSGVP